MRYQLTSLSHLLWESFLSANTSGRAIEEVSIQVSLSMTRLEFNKGRTILGLPWLMEVKDRICGLELTNKWL
jgi:hypothetical protein